MAPGGFGPGLPQGSTVLEGLHLVAAYEAAQGPVEALVVCESRAGPAKSPPTFAGRSAVCLPDGSAPSGP